MGLGILLGYASQQQDRLGQHQLRDTAGVGEWCVEYGNTPTGSRLQVDLVGTDTETAHRHQFVGGFKYFRRQLGAGTDTDEVRVGNLLDQFFLAQ